MYIDICYSNSIERIAFRVSRIPGPDRSFGGERLHKDRCMAGGWGGETVARLPLLARLPPAIPSCTEVRYLNAASY